MATKKPKTEETIETEIETSLMSYEQLSPALEKMYSEMGIEGGEGQANVYVTKVLPDAREARIWQGTPTDYDLTQLAKKYGSGDYRVKLYVQLPNGRFVMKGNQIYPMLLEAGEDARLEAMRRGEGLTPGNAVVAQPAISQQSIAEMIVAGIKAAMPQQQPNNLGMLKEVAEIVRTLAPQAPVAQAAPQINPMELFRIALDLTRRNNDDEEPPHSKGRNATGGDILYNLVDKFAPLFAQTLAAQNGAATVGALPASVAPAQQDANVIPITQAPKPVEDESMRQLKAGLAFLVMQAEAGNDTEAYADVVLDNVPEIALKTFLAQPDPVAYLATIDPNINKYADWFRKLLREVKEVLEAPEDATLPGNDVAPGGQQA